MLRNFNKFNIVFVLTFVVSVVFFYSSFIGFNDDIRDEDYLSSQQNINEQQDAITSINIPYSRPVFTLESQSSVLDTITLNANPGPPNNGGSPAWGMFLNLVGEGSNDVIVTQMSTGSTAGAGASFSVEIFTRSGNALGGPVGSGPGSSSAGWTSIGTVPVTQGSTASGISELFNVPPITVPAGDTVGVAIVFAVVGPRYFGTGTPPYSTYSDTNISLTTGDGRSVPFTPTGSFFSSRALTWAIRYVVDIAPRPGGCNNIAGTWAPALTYPNTPTAVYFAASEWLGDTLYEQTPTTTGGGATTVNRYTIGGSWSAGVPCPVTRTGASLTRCGSKLYLIGGGTTSITAGTNTCYEYDPSTGAWTPKANMPASLSAHSSVCWGDSVIFVVGGPYTGAATNLNVHYYRPASDTWGTITNSLPSGQGRRTFGLGISGNKIVMSCGYNTAYLKSTYVGTIGSDASSITWASAPDCPTAVAGLSRPGSAYYGTAFYLIGGEMSGGGYATDTYLFDVPSSTWVSTITGMPTGRSNIFNQCTARCDNDTVKVYVPGGYNAAAISGFDVIEGGIITGLQDPGTNIPERYSLSQNYPNPFNPSTSIRFELPKSSFVSLKVYDITGREVASLINDERGAGIYIVNFTGDNLSSGTYFYRIQAGDFVEVKKMVLLK